MNFSLSDLTFKAGKTKSLKKRQNDKEVILTQEEREKH